MCMMKIVTKFISEEIENSKNVSLEKLLYALGIRQVGAKTAKVLAKEYKNLDNIMNASLEDLQKINDVGYIIAKSVYDYFRDENNIRMLDELVSIGMNKYYTKIEKTNENFDGKTFVLTGTLNAITREDASSKIEELGGKTSSSVSKNTYAVIVGDKPGSKYDKAKTLGITIWTEEEFLKKINN